MVPDPENSQSFNRYMYTRGNPLRYIDPSGNEESDPIAITNGDGSGGDTSGDSSGGTTVVIGDSSSGDRTGANHGYNPYAGPAVASPYDPSEKKTYVYHGYGYNQGDRAYASPASYSMNTPVYMSGQRGDQSTFWGCMGSSITYSANDFARDMYFGAAVTVTAIALGMVAMAFMPIAVPWIIGGGAVLGRFGQTLVGQNGGVINRHHSFPKFLGGAPKQVLTNMSSSNHLQFHKDLIQFLKNEFPGMVPSRSNPGFDIRRNFTSSELQKAMSDFYRGPGSIYNESAKDFFGQFLNLR